jgi:hypothetical protein
MVDASRPLKARSSDDIAKERGGLIDIDGTPDPNTCLVGNQLHIQTHEIARKDNMRLVPMSGVYQNDKELKLPY